MRVKKFSAVNFSITFLLLFLNSTKLDASQFLLSWPTPNASFAKGLGYHTFLQKTGPDKDFSSGAYGCVRNHGTKFHEGLDLFPVKRTKRGIAEDSIFAAMTGKVVYLSPTARDSAYGKYIVLEHNQYSPNLYSLYAHLEEIDARLSLNKDVQVAQKIGRMGNTASFNIPLNRSHLHFEIGVRLSSNFDKWYNRQKFRTPNKHQNFNGYNLVGLDPLRFYSSYKKSPFNSPESYIKSLPIVTKVQVKFSGTPDLIQRDRSLLQASARETSARSWICSFGPFGFPLSFESSSSIPTQPVKVISYDEKNDSDRCRKLIVRKSGELLPSDQLNAYLELIFLD
jgi:murein DD-endopeptidase MepM/ murein hydrolase activator NlpD